jgi:hypothetical protein
MTSSLTREFCCATAAQENARQIAAAQQIDFRRRVMDPGNLLTALHPTLLNTQPFPICGKSSQQPRRSAQHDIPSPCLDNPRPVARLHRNFLSRHVGVADRQAVLCVDPDILQNHVTNGCFR